MQIMKAKMESDREPNESSMTALYALKPYKSSRPVVRMILRSPPSGWRIFRSVQY